MKQPPVCEHKDRRRVSRGLCGPCYMRLYRVETGRTTYSRFPVPTPEAPSERMFARVGVYPSFRAEPLPQFDGPMVLSLTVKQERVLRAVVEFGSVKEAAYALGNSRQTITNHLSEVYIRTGSSTGLIGALLALGWLCLPDESRKQEAA